MGSFEPEIGCAPLEVGAVGARLWIAWSAKGLTRVAWSPAQAPAAEALDAPLPPEATLPARYRDVLVAYLAGGEAEPAELPIDPRGTAFQRRVWDTLRRIPRGRVRTYGGIAAEIGSPRAMRAVGSANGRNPLPIVVPCHRVIEAGSRLGGYTGGLHLKRFLLDLEGVKIVGDHVQPGQLELI